MRTIADSADLNLERPVAGAFARRRGRFVLIVSVVLMPLVFMLCFNAFRAVLGNEAFASVSDDYNPATFFHSADAARAVRILQNKVMRDPQQIESLDTAQILSLFNRPGLRRVEGPYRHWQYVSDLCVMDIYMKLGYGDEPAHPVRYIDFGRRRTAYYQPAKTDTASDAMDDSVDTKACVESMMTSQIASLFR